MREQKSGSIINISSLSGKSGTPGQTNYSAAKAGIVGLTKAAAKELAHHNVRVNSVQPGLIRTAMTEAMPPEVFAELLRAHDDGVAEFLDLARVKPNTLGTTRMIVHLDGAGDRPGGGSGGQAGSR